MRTLQIGRLILECCIICHYVNSVYFYGDDITKQLFMGPVSRRPRKVFAPEKRSKISNLTSTELFYSHVLSLNRGSLVTRGLSVCTSPFLDTHELKMV